MFLDETSHLEGTILYSFLAFALELTLHCKQCAQSLLGMFSLLLFAWLSSAELASVAGVLDGLMTDVLGPVMDVSANHPRTWLLEAEHVFFA